MKSPEEHELTPDEARARGAIRSLPQVAAESGFRERLRANFVAGSLAGAGAGAPVAGRRAARPWFRLGFLVPAAAAAGLVIVLSLSRGPVLEVADVTGVGVVTVDGRPYETTDRAGLARALRAGARVELSEGVELDLVQPGTVVYQLSSATMTIPRTPARWLAKALECRLEMGEIRILTGPEFRSSQVLVTTPEGMILVTGTLVSVFRDEAVTCVCVHEGTARVGIDTDDLEPIQAGKRKVMYADRRPPIITEIAPPHDEHLIEFRAKYRAGIR
jgi:ferric-dicitrate binding protein FerR (iron transport regulator)